MKLSSLLIGMLFAVAVIATLLLVFGVNFHRPTAAQGAALYNPANEVLIKGAVEKTEEFSCPVGEGEMGSHLLVRTDDGIVQVHLVAARILRSQNVKFVPGDNIQVVGAKFRFHGDNDLIAREIMRGSETFVFRDAKGELLMMQ